MLFLSYNLCLKRPLTGFRRTQSYTSCEKSLPWFLGGLHICLWAFVPCSYCHLLYFRGLLSAAEFKLKGVVSFNLLRLTPLKPETRAGPSKSCLHCVEEVRMASSSIVLFCFWRNVTRGCLCGLGFEGFLKKLLSGRSAILTWSFCLHGGQT